MKRLPVLLAAFFCMLLALTGCEDFGGASSSGSVPSAPDSALASLPVAAEVSSVPSGSSAAAVPSAAPVSSVSSAPPELLAGEDVLIRPPVLKIICGGEEATVQQGGYNWYYGSSDGQETSILADGPQPLDRRGQLELLETSADKAAVQCEVMPDSMTVSCWSDECWNGGTATQEAAAVSGNEITLKQGGYIYEIEAHWTSRPGYHGWCRYAFYVKSQ